MRIQIFKILIFYQLRMGTKSLYNFIELFLIINFFVLNLHYLLARQQISNFILTSLI